MSVTSATLEIRGITRRFGKYAAVSNVDISIPHGQMVGIIGRSGAGKSTLLRMINRLIDPSQGSIFFDGAEVSQLRGSPLRRWQRDCAMIFQQFNLVPRLDVLTNVLLGRLNHRSTLVNLLGVFSREERAEAIAEARSSRENMPSRLSAVERWFSRPSSTLVSTSRRGTRLNCWKIMAQSRCQRRSAGPASADTSVWSKKIDPWVGSIRRLIMRRRVDLPAPERPMMPTICPWGISRATRSTAVFLPKRRVTSRICSMAASLSSAAFTATAPIA